MTGEFLHSSAEDSVEVSMQFYDSATTGVRRVGMIDRATLEEALRDPRTIMAELDDGTEVAVAVPMDYGHGAGYDARRTTEEILPYGSRSHTLLYLPSGGLLERLGDDGYARLVERFAALRDGYVFSSYDTHDHPLATAPFELERILRDAGKVVANVPLLDSKAAPGNQEASLSLYGFDLPRHGESQGRPLVSLADVYNTYERNVAAGVYDRDMENGVVMMRGSDISDDQAADMWQTYRDRFQWLGENHPISMEDSEAEFMQLLRSGSTLCSIRFVDGRPECFTDLVDDPKELYWLKEDFLTDPVRMQLEPNQRLVFLPGIVASKEGQNRSAEVIQLLINSALDSGGSFKVMFENTNRSERYIPRIVHGVVNGVGREQIEMPQVVDKTNYVCTRFVELTESSQPA